MKGGRIQLVIFPPFSIMISNNVKMKINIRMLGCMEGNHDRAGENETGLHMGR